MTEPGNTSGPKGVDEGVHGTNPTVAPDIDVRPIVMKFGGSSVADLEGLRRVGAFVVQRAAVQPVVVVVSAMGKTTDGLVEQARALCATPSRREMDMLLTTGERISMSLLSLAIHGQGREAVSLTGSQCGIITDHQHGRARVMEVRPFRILDELAAGHIVIVGGFQGVSYKREVTTLGRGGSDTTAVALAAALGCDCEIYSDVDGVYSADPRIVEGAQRIEELDYAQMRALSWAGAKVLHARAVELAEERGVAIYARATPSTASTAPSQTVIRSNTPRRSVVTAVACDRSVIDVRVEFPRASSPSGALAARLGALGLRHLSGDERGASGVLSTTQRDDAMEVVQRIREHVLDLFDGLGVVHARAGLALVSCIGRGLGDRSEFIEHAHALLAEAGVEVQAFHVEMDCIGFLVPAPDANSATRALHAGLVATPPA